MTDDATNPRPFARLVEIFNRNRTPILFFGLNCLGSAFWAKYGHDKNMGLFVDSAIASVVSSGLLTLIRSDAGGERFDDIKRITKNWFAGPLHNATGVPTIIVGCQLKDTALVVLGTCTVAGSLFAVWGEPLLEGLRKTSVFVEHHTGVDKLMKALKIDKFSLPKNPDANTAAFIFYLGVIPTVFKDALHFSAPYLALAGACYTTSILSLPLRRPLPRPQP